MNTRVIEDYDLPLGTVFEERAVVQRSQWVFVGYYYTVQGPSACFMKSLTATEPVHPSFPWEYRVSYTVTFEKKFIVDEKYRRSK